MNRGRRYAIAGWFGSGNFGDELILHSLLRLLEEFDPEASITVLCARPLRVSELHGLRAVLLPVIRGRQNAAGPAVRHVLGEADVLFLGPGTVFQERSDAVRWPGTIPMLARLVLLAKAKKALVYVCGGAVREGGTIAGRTGLRGLGMLCAAIGVRDESSAAIFGRRAEVIGDLAMTLPARESSSGATPRGGTFAVSMRPLAKSVESAQACALRAVVRELQLQGGRGLFMPMSHGDGAYHEDDRTIYDAYFADLIDIDSTHITTAPYAHALRNWLESLSHLDLMLATRLHAAIPAILAGVPTVAFAYERKVTVTMEQLGLGAYVLPTAATVDDVLRTSDAARSEEGRAHFAHAAAEAAIRARRIRRFVERAVGLS